MRLSGKQKEGMQLRILNWKQMIQYFAAGTKPADVNPVKEDVGNGYLAALSGTVGKELSSLGLLFQSSEVKTGQRILIPRFSEHLSVDDIRSVMSFTETYNNLTDGPVDWNFNKTKQCTSTQEWRKSHSEQCGVDASVTGGLLGISFGGGASLSVSDTEEHGRSWSDSTIFN